jgi:hypothetical protein
MNTAGSLQTVQYMDVYTYALKKLKTDIND